MVDGVGAPPIGIRGQRQDPDRPAERVIGPASPEQRAVAAVVLDHEEANEEAGRRHRQQQGQPVAVRQAEEHEQPQGHEGDQSDGEHESREAEHRGAVAGEHCAALPRRRGRLRGRDCRVRVLRHLVLDGQWHVATSSVCVARPLLHQKNGSASNETDPLSFGVRGPKSEGEDPRSRSSWQPR